MSTTKLQIRNKSCDEYEIFKDTINSTDTKNVINHDENSQPYEIDKNQCFIEDDDEDYDEFDDNSRDLEVSAEERGAEDETGTTNGNGDDGGNDKCKLEKKTRKSKGKSKRNTRCRSPTQVIIF